MNGRWLNFCIVGVGGHARNRLIPALEANGQTLAGTVSRGGATHTRAPVFTRVEHAVAELPRDTVFVIASPPDAHFEHATAVLAAGRDAIVEKPSFVRAVDARAALDAADRAGAILVEGFMNRYTTTHRRVVTDIASRPVASINVDFILPSVPTGTFRSGPSLGASNLFDIASYGIATLIDVGLPTDDLVLAEVVNAGAPDREFLVIGGHAQGVAVAIRVGVGDAYQNTLHVRYCDGGSLRVSPFTYGRPGPRSFHEDDGQGSRETVVEDINAFEAMFARPREAWLADRAVREAALMATVTTLERLGADLLRFRALAAGQSG